MMPRPPQPVRKASGDVVARHLYRAFARAGFQREGRRLWWERGSHRIKDERVLDLSALEGLTELEELRLTFGGRLQSLTPLRALPRLCDVRLRGTTVADGDLSPLDELRPTASVVRPDE